MVVVVVVVVEVVVVVVVVVAAAVFKIMIFFLNTAGLYAIFIALLLFIYLKLLLN